MSRLWAVVRVGLGVAQVMGATVTLFFLLTTGTTALTVWAAAAPLSLTALSRLLFARPDRKE